MATDTAQSPGVDKPRRRLINTFDSPWFNPRFLLGSAMVLSVVLMGLLGPLFWDTRMALVASAPLNLPPAWINQAQSAEVLSRVDTARTAQAPQAEATAAPTRASGFGAGGLGGSGLTELMTTQTHAAPTAAPTRASGFGAGGLGGSGLTELMTTQTQAAPTAAPTRASGFGAGGLGGSGLTELMTTQTQTAPSTAAAETAPSTDTTAPGTFGRTVAQLSGDWAHPLGTDNSGRDMLAVLIVGAPASLRVGVIAAAVGTILGVILGFSSGFIGGWVDSFIRTAADVWLTIPALAVLLVISSYMRRVDLETMGILLALFAWPGPTRLLRAQVLTMRERGYVRMARLSGQSSLSIMFREMLPNLLPYLAASFAGNVSGAILAATSLEALGLGPTRYPTLGTTIFNALRATAIMRGMWWWWGLPVATLIFIFSGLFLVATGLDEIANPRLRGVQGKS
jgi:peptide/nickel transport system permease protein